MREIPIARRIALALTGIILSGYVLRPQMSQALIVRGDERLYRGNASQALGYYRRAIEMNPYEGSAVDRFAFAAASLRDRSAAREAIALTSAYLHRRPMDDVVRMDRAMAFRLLGDWSHAMEDFETVGERERDAAAMTFAGYAAEAEHDRSRALRLWRRALTFDGSFRAARNALRGRGEPI